MGIEGVAVLADQGDPIVVVDGHDPHGHVRVVDDAVDAGLTIRPRDVVVIDGQPGVLVGDTTPVAGPGADGSHAPPGDLGRHAPDPHACGCSSGAARPAAETGERAVRPPSTVQTAPVTYDAASDSRKATTEATSSRGPHASDGHVRTLRWREEGHVERGVDGAGRDDVDADPVAGPDKRQRARKPFDPCLGGGVGR